MFCLYYGENWVGCKILTTDLNGLLLEPEQGHHPRGTLKKINWSLNAACYEDASVEHRIRNCDDMISTPSRQEKDRSSAGSRVAIHVALIAWSVLHQVYGGIRACRTSQVKVIPQDIHH